MTKGSMDNYILNIQSSQNILPAFMQTSFNAPIFTTHLNLLKTCMYIVQTEDRIIPVCQQLALQLP